MKQHLYRIGVAFLTLTIGIIITSVWIVKHYSKPSDPVTSATIKFLHPAKESLPCVVSRGDIASVKELIASGADVNSTADSCIHMEPSPRGVTLLMKSAAAGDLEMVKLLLANGADVNAISSWRDTPLTYAIGGGRIEIIGFLIEKGADVNARAEYDRTLLMMASSAGNPEIINCLLNKGADINAKDKNGTTAMMFAAANKHPEIMSFLSERGANSNSKDEHGRTAEIYLKKGFPKEYIIVKM